MPPTTPYKLSVSKTKTYVDCKRKFKFSYIDKLPKKDWAHLTYGKFIHRILELFHQYYLESGNDPCHVVMGRCFNQAVKEFKAELTPEQKKEGYEALNSYLNIWSNPEIIRSSILSVEKQFNVNIDDTVLLNGMIDRVQVDPDGMIHVADYKTTKDKKYLKNDWFQLLTYAYVMMLEDPSIETVRGSYVLIRHGFEYITSEFKRADVLKIKDKYLQYQIEISEEKLWRANPTFLCKFCDFLESCEEGKKQVYKGDFFGPTDWT